MSLRPLPRCIPKCLTRAALANPARDTSATLPLRRVSRRIVTFTFTEVRFLYDGPRVGFLSLPTGKEIPPLNSLFKYPKECWHSCPVQKHHKYHANKLHYTTHSEPPTRPCYAYEFELPSMKTYYDVTRGRLYRPFSRDVTKCFHKWQRRTGWQESRFSYSNGVKLAYLSSYHLKTVGTRGLNLIPEDRMKCPLQIVY